MPGWLALNSLTICCIADGGPSHVQNVILTLPFSFGHGFKLACGARWASANEAGLFTGIATSSGTATAALISRVRVLLSGIGLLLSEVGLVLSVAVP
jgi:hypothetical protein